MSWYQLGVFGAYGGNLHSLYQVNFDEKAEENYNKFFLYYRQENLHCIKWCVDMGSATDTALDVLDTCLRHFSEVFGLKPTELSLGTRDFVWQTDESV